MNQRSKIAILGFGVEGTAVFEYLHKNNFPNITICDRNVDLEDKMPEGVSVRLGESYLDDLDDFDVIFRSPGIRFHDPHIQKAAQRGAEVTSCTAFFLDQCPCSVIGVSGTKGKGTTSTLLHYILKKSGKDSYLGGNIGEPAVNFLDKLKNDSIVVLEMSSFQLQDLTKSPHYSILLNTTSEHLDYHEDTGEYLEAKESILSHQNEKSVVIMNEDYKYINHYKPLVKGDLFTVSKQKKVKNGAFVKDFEIFYSKSGEVEKIMDVKDVKLLGSHNLENVMPAIVVAKELGVKNEVIVKVVSEFQGLPHRLEFVRELKGVRYYNDSFSTTPETSMAAVDSFDEPMVLIAGGHDKGGDYSDWALKILTKENLHSVILMGSNANKMEKALIEAEEKLGEALGSPTKIIRRGTLDQVVIEAYAEAEEGGVVVLSPGAASFDMFKNYKERGREFAIEVRRLK